MHFLNITKVNPNPAESVDCITVSERSESEYYISSPCIFFRIKRDGLSLKRTITFQMQLLHIRKEKPKILPFAENKNEMKTNLVSCGYGSCNETYSGDF